MNFSVKIGTNKTKWFSILEKWFKWWKCLCLWRNWHLIWLTYDILISLQFLEWFWAIVASFTDEQMARLLQFTTGSSQLPPGGFNDLDPKFTISFTSYSTNSLPTAHTWYVHCIGKNVFVMLRGKRGRWITKIASV